MRVEQTAATPMRTRVRKLREDSFAWWFESYMWGNMDVPESVGWLRRVRGSAAELGPEGERSRERTERVPL